MAFTGQAECTIDAKGRLAIPAKFRARWDPKRDGLTWFGVPWPADRVLRLYTESEFERLADMGRGQPSLTPSRDRADLETMLFSHTEQLDIDSNNRIKLPAWQVELLGLPREVVVLGAGNRLEIRSRDDWMSDHRERFAELEQLAARVTNPNGPAA